MAAKKKAPKRKASGVNIEEWQRKTTKVQLRLPKDVAELLAEKAADQEVHLSEYVTRLMRTMRDNPTVTCGMILEDLEFLA